MKNGKLLIQLAKIGQYGHARTPKSFSMGDSYCEYYWSPGKHLLTFEQWQKVAKLSYRYKRYCHYVEEILPEWEETGKIYWADNSVEVIQRNKFGEKRTVPISAPGGDICF